MTTLRKAAQQALEVLERAGEELRWQAIGQVQRDLRAALAEPEQEPVAWIFVDDTGMKFVSVDRPHRDYQPLYTAPPQRKPLQDEKIVRWVASGEYNVITNDWASHIDFARAIERAHGIGDNT